MAFDSAIEELTVPRKEFLKDCRTGLAKTREDNMVGGDAICEAR